MQKSVASIDEEFFSRFNYPQQIKKGEIVLRAGESPSGIYFLKKGYVRIYSISESGQEITFNIFKPGSYLFMMWALSGVPNIYYFEAVTDITILKAPKKETVDFIKNNPQLLFVLTKRTMSGLEGIIRVMQTLLSSNANSKVATIFLVLAKRFGKKRENNEIFINLPITHKLISSLACLTRETTSLVIENLVKEKIITQENHFFVVINLKSLELESSLPETEI